MSLYALDSQHGTLRWQKQQPEQAYVILVEKGVVYVTAADGQYALNASNGILPVYRHSAALMANPRGRWRWARIPTHQQSSSLPHSPSPVAAWGLGPLA
jgi:hypothetical protein